MAETKKFQRLPKDVRPISYTLHFDPSWRIPTNFTCEEIINVHVINKTNQILLNASNIRLLTVTYEDQTGTGSDYGMSYGIDEKAQIMTINFESVLLPGMGKLMLTFIGRINNDLKGFYRSKPTCSGAQDEEEDESDYTYVTHFESCFCRRAFPCWDEPEFKATFKISLVLPRNRTGLSNMPILTDEPHAWNPKLHVLTFQKTPIMSTYLVAFAIGDFQFVQNVADHGVICRVYTPPGKSRHGKFALNIAIKAVNFFSDYFGVPFPLPKLDMIPVADFSCGAMENWGLITFRESMLLVDEEHSSKANTQIVARVVSHEICHAWFGNLVTMKWWSDVWLKEGLATFLEYLYAEYVTSDFNVWTQFSTETFIKALELDALRNSHPVQVCVGDPSQVDEIFDSISYEKGASIIRMLYHYVGAEKFQAGLTIYLNRHAYDSADTSDLWAALEETSGKPVQVVMTGWIEQMGFPLVTVLDEDLHLRKTRRFALTQSKFTANIEDINDSSTTTSYKWFIPITIIKGSDPKNLACKDFVMNPNMKEPIQLVIGDVAQDEWVKVNSGLLSFCRVSYSDKTLRQFIPALHNLTLPPLDRLGLLDDLFAFVKAGHDSSEKILNFLLAYKNEDDCLIWGQIKNILDTFSTLLMHTDLHEKLNLYGQHVFMNISTKLGWGSETDESPQENLLRMDVKRVMVLLGDFKSIKAAKELFTKQANGELKIEADLRFSVYASVLKGPEHEVLEAFNRLLRMYRNSDLLEERVRILLALATVEDSFLLDRLLHFLLSKFVKPQDALWALVQMAATNVGQLKAWNFFKSNCAYFQTRIPSGHLILQFVKNFTELFSTEEMAVDVETFFKENHFSGASRSVQQAVETIRNKAAWLERDIDALRGFLTDYV